MSDSFEHGSLKIDIAKEGSRLAVVWSGVSDSRAPHLALQPFSSQVTEAAANAEVDLDFNQLTYANSSTVGPIILLVQALSDVAQSVTVRYDPGNPFQISTFSVLQELGGTMGNVFFVKS